MDASRLRQKILFLFNEIDKVKGELITRKPMARGTVYKLKRKCGKANCRCIKGKLHKQMCISITRDGKTTLRPIRGKELERLEKLTKFHRRFRKARAQFVKLSNQIVKSSNQLEKEMLKKSDLIMNTKKRKIKGEKRK